MNKNSGSDKGNGTVTLPQLNHDLYRVIKREKLNLKVNTNNMKTDSNSVEVRGTGNTVDFERVMNQFSSSFTENFLKVVESQFGIDIPSEVVDSVEYEGNRIPKSEILVLVWEDEDCREEGLNYQLDGSDFEGDDFDEIIESIKEFYEDEIERNEGCIEVEVNEKPILHISPDSDYQWEVIK